MRSNPTILLLGLFALMAAAGTAAQATPLTLLIRDSQNGEPAATRLSIVGEDGPLFGDLDPVLRTHLDIAYVPYLYAEDRIDLDLPAGEIRIRTAGGLNILPREYLIIVEENPQSPQERTLLVEKWIDPRDWGWFSADPHVHLGHQGEENLPDRYPISVNAAGRAGRAEGLDLLYLLENRASSPSGLADPHQENITVSWGEEFRSGFWGHVVVLGAKNLVTVDSHPWANGPGLSAWPLLQKVLQDTQPPLAYLAHPHTGGTNYLVRTWPETGEARELPSLALAGCLNGVACGSGSNDPARKWNLEPLLDGLAVGARWASLGETDGVLSRHFLRPVGSLRTYAHIDRASTPGRSLLDRQWRAAVVAGRSYATSGPLLLEYRLDDAMVGDTLHPSGRSAVLHLRLVSWTPLVRITLHGMDGRWQDLPFSSSQANEFTFEQSIELNTDDALVIEAVADGGTWFAPQDSLYMVSSPIFVDTGTAASVPLDRARANSDLLAETWSKSLRSRGYTSSADSAAARQILLASSQAWESLADDPPGPFHLIYPATAQVIGSSGLQFSWTHARSYDGEALEYDLQLGLDPSFSQPKVYSAGADTFLLVGGLESNQRYWWRVMAREPDGDSTSSLDEDRYFEISANAVDAPAAMGSLFRLTALRSEGSGARMAMDLGNGMEVRLRWFDARGRLIRSSPRTRYGSGRHLLQWDGRDDRGRKVASGAFWLVADAEGRRSVCSTVLLDH